MVLKYVEPPEKFVGRESWTADPQEGKISPLKLPVNNVFVTFTETDQCAQSAKDLKSCGEIVKEIQERAIWEHNMPDIPYNFLLGGDGFIYEGRGWRLRPEDIPNEPELNANNDTLVLAYIGRKSDNIPRYRMKVLLSLEDSFFRFGLSRRFINEGAKTVMGPGWDLDENFSSEESEEDTNEDFGDDDEGMDSEAWRKLSENANDKKEGDVNDSADDVNCSEGDVKGSADD